MQEVERLHENSAKAYLKGTALPPADSTHFTYAAATYDLCSEQRVRQHLYDSTIRPHRDLLSRAVMAGL